MVTGTVQWVVLAAAASVGENDWTVMSRSTTRTCGQTWWTERCGQRATRSTGWWPRATCLLPPRTSLRSRVGRRGCHGAGAAARARERSDLDWPAAGAILTRRPGRERPPTAAASTAVHGMALGHRLAAWRSRCRHPGRSRVTPTKTASPSCASSPKRSFASAQAEDECDRPG